jgi:hypothetical protein
MNHPASSRYPFAPPSPPPVKRLFFPALLLLLPSFDLVARKPHRVQRMLAQLARWRIGVATGTSPQPKTQSEVE